jgi:small-conductance mechanosensitive channel
MCRVCATKRRGQLSVTLDSTTRVLVEHKLLAELSWRCYVKSELSVQLWQSTVSRSWRQRCEDVLRKLIYILVSLLRSIPTLLNSHSEHFVLWFLKTVTFSFFISIFFIFITLFVHISKKISGCLFMFDYIFSHYNPYPKYGITPIWK